VSAVLAGDRASLARTITLVESTRPDHQLLAQTVLQQLLPHSGRAVRVGISGMPGAGKSTFIDALGWFLTEQVKRRVAVLAVDPSSTKSGGSILGDRTRMPRLSNSAAFIRPSPSAGSLGGVTRKTREAMLVCEAAGYDVILVETVGVGQSEAAVAGMVDCFLLLVVTGAGDGLQAIKRGVIEHIDFLAVTKADGDNLRRAEQTAREYASALTLFASRAPGFAPKAVTLSSLEGRGVREIWAEIEGHQSRMRASGELEKLRSEQRVHWMWNCAEQQLLSTFRRCPQVEAIRAHLSAEVAAGALNATQAASLLLDAFRRTA
jgi:LAO/AO transport system kinase